MLQYQRAASAMACNQRGLAQLKHNQAQRAIEHLNEAIQLDTRFAGAYINRAVALTLLGMNAEAERDVERAAQLGGIEPALLKLGIGEFIESLKNEC